MASVDDFVLVDHPRPRIARVSETVRMTTRNFEEAVLARQEKRPPVFRD